MEELTTIATYREFKTTLDNEVKKVADGFVRMGYLLKVARDTDILQESGYKTVTEFAKAEYGFEKDVVSRYIAINDRYSVDGYSEALECKYQGYGYAKLAEMLTLSDEVIESINPSLTKREIQQIKDEIKEESKISEIEVMMEERDPKQVALDSTLDKSMHQYCKDNAQDYIELWSAVYETLDTGRGEVIEKIMDAIAPSGIKTIMIRIPGTGRLMVSINGKEQNIIIVNTRSNEKEEYTWEQMIMAIENICDSEVSAQESWQQLYGEEFPKEEEVAPVQPKTEQKAEPRKQEDKKTLKISTPRPQKKEEIVDKPLEEVVESEEPKEEEQIPGQAVITDYPEVLPEKEQEEDDQEELERVDGEIVANESEEQPEAKGYLKEAEKQIDIIQGTYKNKEYKWTIQAAENLIKALREYQEQTNE